jgi:hypothetical protein
MWSTIELATRTLPILLTNWTMSSPLHRIAWHSGHGQLHGKCERITIATFAMVCASPPLPLVLSLSYYSFFLVKSDFLFVVNVIKIFSLFFLTNTRLLFKYNNNIHSINCYYYIIIIIIIIYSCSI